MYDPRKHSLRVTAYEGSKHVEGHKPHKPYGLRDAVAHAVFLFAISMVLWAIAGFPGAM